MRHQRLNDMLQVLAQMQASADGLTLDDIGQILGGGRRTAERVRDALLCAVPAIVETADIDRRKRWRLPANALDRLFVPTAEELAALDLAANLLKREATAAQADAVERLAAKMRAHARRDRFLAADADGEALIEAQGLVARPGPRPKIDPAVLEALRRAILECRVVRLRYRSRGSRKVSRQVLQPYGFLYGHRHYLVAWSTNEWAEDFRLFSLGDIQAVEFLKESFTRDPGFDLEAFAAQSFGVFQEPPINIVWRVAPEAAHEARDYLFHPSQRLEEQPDGSLLIHFRTGGVLEMSWHLATWDGRITVIRPKDFARRVQRILATRWPQEATGADVKAKT